MERMTQQRLLVLAYFNEFIIEGCEDEVHPYKLQQATGLFNPTLVRVLATFEQEGLLSSRREVQGKDKRNRHLYRPTDKGQKDIPALLRRYHDRIPPRPWCI